MPPHFGRPLNVRIASTTSAVILQPTLGLSGADAPTDLDLGQTPDSENYIMRYGALEPRPMLSLRQTSPQPMGDDPILGLFTISDTSGVEYILASGTTRHANYKVGYAISGWNPLSYASLPGTSATPVNDPPAASNTSYWDAAAVYDAQADQNLLVLANDSYQSLYVWRPGDVTFSTLTGAPRGQRVASYNNYLLTFNVLETGGSELGFVTRVQWTDRGSASSWTGGLSGYEDLLDMRGYGTRIIVQDSRLLLFSNEEIWQGTNTDNVFIFSFAPLDRTLGCPFPWTVTQTPLGVVFMAKDYTMYLIPKGGGAPQPLSIPVGPILRNEIDAATNAWTAYDPFTKMLQLNYPVRGGSGYPQRALWMNMEEGSWARQSFDRTGGNLSLTRGASHIFRPAASSSGTTWGGLSNASMRWADLAMSWRQFYSNASADERLMLVGSSNGTLYYFNSNATSDSGATVRSYWRSGGLATNAVDRQKTISEFRVDYQSPSASSVTVRFSSDMGQSYFGETGLSLVQSSGVSQAIAYPYGASRYLSFEVSSENQQNKLYRFWLKYRESGR